MAKKIIKLGSSPAEVLSIEIGDTTYSLPLAGSMTRKELKALTDEEAVHDMLLKHIPEEVLDALPMNDYNRIVKAWADVNAETQGATLGES